MWITWIFDIWFYDKYAVKKGFVDKKKRKIRRNDENEEFQKTGLKSWLYDGIIASIRIKEMIQRSDSGNCSEKLFRHSTGGMHAGGRNGYV